MDGQQRAYIEVQDISGDWKRVTSVVRQDQVILRNMDAVARQTKRLVRAVDTSGNILQMGEHPGLLNKIGIK